MISLPTCLEASLELFKAKNTSINYYHTIETKMKMIKQTNTEKLQNKREKQ